MISFFRIEAGRMKEGELATAFEDPKGYFVLNLPDPGKQLHLMANADHMGWEVVRLEVVNTRNEVEPPKIDLIRDVANKLWQAGDEVMMFFNPRQPAVASQVYLYRRIDGEALKPPVI